jgi:hypothetical protein
MPAPMIPVAIVAERVAVKSGLAEIVEPAEILRHELIMSELVVAECLEMIPGELVVATGLVMGQRIAGMAVIGKSRSIA